jgi:hypothetical protein
MSGAVDIQQERAAATCSSAEVNTCPAPEERAREAASLLSAALRRPVRVVAARGEPCAFATVFPAERLRLTLDDGRELSLFVKHLGDEQSDHPDKQRRDRETLVYERLLAGHPDLPVPRYYGTSTNRGTGRRELFLEYIEDWNLKYHGLPQWFAAARALAHLHAHFAERGGELRACDFLLRLDGGYLQGWATRAVEAAGAYAPDLAARLREVVRGYGRVEEVLARRPATLVHNDLAPKNVIADRGGGATARVCFVDWEMTGVGCGLMDLVHLKYGLGEAADRAMVGAYRAALAHTSLLPQDESEFVRALTACELHKTQYRIAHAVGWRLPAQRAVEWVSAAEAYMRVLRGG